MEAGNPAPTVFGDGRELYVAYWARNPEFPSYNSGASFDHPGFRQNVAMLKFNAISFRFGYPNEEALAGHPLHKYGLNWYGFHIVENSPWIEELATQNKVHSMNDPAGWRKLLHWIITFHDETLEVVGRHASVLPLVENSFTTSIRFLQTSKRCSENFMQSIQTSFSDGILLMNHWIGRMDVISTRGANN